MADEFTVQATLKISKGFEQDSKTTGNITISQTGDGSIGGSPSIGTTAEAIDVGDLTTLGLAWFRNLEAVGGNFVQIGQDVGGGGFEEFCKLLPGEPALMRLDLAATGVLQAKADTAAVQIQYKIYEE
jgi:hypothetical protein